MNGQLDFTVATSFRRGLEREARLVKVGLLYGDHVRLVQPLANVQLSLREKTKLPPKEFLRYMMDTLGEVANPHRQFLEDVLGSLESTELGGLAGDALPEGRRAAFMRQIQSVLQRSIGKTLRETHASEIEAAVRSGRLTLHPFEIEADDAAVQLEWARAVSDQVFEGGYLLFDEALDASVRQGLKLFQESISSDEEFAQKLTAVERVAKETKFVRFLFDRLPVFDEAPMPEVLRMRKKLGKHLHRFRGAVLGLVEQMKSDSHAENFQREADVIFRKDVQPTLEELRAEAQRRNRLSDLKGSATFINIGLTAYFGTVVDRTCLA